VTPSAPGRAFLWCLAAAAASLRQAVERERGRKTRWIRRTSQRRRRSSRQRNHAVCCWPRLFPSLDSCSWVPGCAAACSAGWPSGAPTQPVEQADYALAQVKKLEGSPAGSFIPNQGQPLSLSGWQEMAGRLQQASLPKFVQAYQLLSLSIGLTLGGTSLWLLGVPARRAKTAYEGSDSRASCSSNSLPRSQSMVFSATGQRRTCRTAMQKVIDNVV